MRVFLLILVALASVAPAEAAVKKRVPAKTRLPSVAKRVAPVQTAFRRSPYVGAMAIDAATGKVLFEANADQPAYPASVTKLMTLLLTLEEVKAGKIALDAKIEATADVYRSEPSWIGLKVGDKMTVRDLCLALMVESANDAAIALGVSVAGSFDAFVARMNERAKELGMASTTYYNPNGLPPNAGKRYPWKDFNVTTARDQVKLARQLVAMPDVLALTSVKTCDLIKTADGFRVSVTRQTNKPLHTTTLSEGEKLVASLKNHNNVMRMDKLKLINPDGKEAVDGLKTGYIDAGGSSIILTGQRQGKRAIVIVLGSSSSDERDAHARKLLTDALGAIAW